MNLRRYDCKTVLNMLPLHVGDDLDPRHVDGVDRHLSSCLPCFRAFREHVGMRGRLQVLADEPLPAGILDGFAEEVMARVAVGEPGPAAQAPRPGPGVILLPRVAAAAAVLLVALAGWRLFDDGGVPVGQGPTLAADPSLTGEVATVAPMPAARVPVPMDPTGWPRQQLQPAGTSPHAIIDPGMSSPSSLDMELMRRGGPAVRVLIIQGQMPQGTGLMVDDQAREPRRRDQ